jgi:hypothetical protein
MSTGNDISYSDSSIVKFGRDQGTKRLKKEDARQMKDAKNGGADFR